MISFHQKILSFVFLLNACTITVSRGESVTYHNKYLAGLVIGNLNTRDWMQCLSACAASEDCVSYNFNPNLGTCELLSVGLNLGRNCDGRRSLVHSQGVIFHQIKGTCT